MLELASCIHMAALTGGVGGSTGKKCFQAYNDCYQVRAGVMLPGHEHLSSVLLLPGMHVLFFKRMLLPGRVLLPGIHQNKSKCNKCKLKGTPQYMRGFTSRANEMRCRRP